MQDFVIGPDGLVREERIHDAAQRASQLFGDVDPLTFEASTLLIRVFKSIREPGEAYLAQFGLTGSRLAILETLHRREGHRLTVGEISVELGVTATNISKLLDSLERELWVTRVPNPDDGRSTYAQLTAAGLDQLNLIRPVLAARRTEIWSVLTREEKEILVHLLAKLHMSLNSKSITWKDLSNVR